MGLLDKLKPQPRWKHADPAIRLDAVRDVDDAAELAALAESDVDVRVRKSALVRLTDPAVLGRIAANDADAETRDRAADRLLALATGAELDEAGALEAAAGIEDPRRLSVVAKSEAGEPVRANALARITDQRALGAITRHAKHESTAAAALDRLTDAGELLDTAQNSDHRDVALRAFDRAVPAEPEVALLREIEDGAKQKAVAKRARAMIQAIEAAEAARRVALEERRQRQTALVERAGQLAAAAEPAAARQELDGLAEAWETVGPADDQTSARFARAVADARTAIAVRERDIEEAAEQARMRAEALASREALCLRVETLDAEDAPEQLVPIEEEWRSLMPLVGDGPEAVRLAERFATAVAACRQRHERSAALAETRARLEALVGEAEGLPSQNDAAAAVARWHALAREARGLGSSLAEVGRPADELAARLSAVDAAFAAREAARREAAVKAQQDLAARLQRLAERGRRAAEADTVTLREGERLMRDFSAAFEEAGRADSSREIEDAVRLLHTAQEQVAPRVRDLREMDEWRRFANGQQQEQLIAMAEAIVASLKSDEESGKPSDLPATARALKELHAKWHDVAEGPRHAAQRLWDRFRLATDFIRSRCEVHFAQLREERTTNLRRKAAIVEEAEALVSSTDWVRTTQRLQALQAEWQQTGPAPREAGHDLAHRFRTACNLFFAHRRDDMGARKKTWSDNLAQKEALCARAETLADSTDWDAAAAEIKRLQAEWKTIGPVRRNKSEAIWNRFRAAADRFFERFHNRHQIMIEGKLAEREAMVVALEQVAGEDAIDAPADLADRVQQLRTTWSRSVPIPIAAMQGLADRWQAALTTIVSRWPQPFAGTDLDTNTVLQKMQKLVARVETLASDTQETHEGQSQTEILAARLRNALASNAMGGRASDEGKWRTAAAVVKEAQASWQRLAPVAGAEAQALERRFRDACRRVLDQVRRQSAAPSGPRRPAKPTAAMA